MSIYHDEYGNVKPPSAFTQFAGGILDSYYLKVSEAEREVKEFRKRNDGLEYDYSSMKNDRDRWQKEAEREKTRADGAEVKGHRLQGTIDTQATEIAKRDKAIEQYAAWRVAVREALKDLTVVFDGDLPADEVWRSDQVSRTQSVLKRIADLTAEKTVEES